MASNRDNRRNTSVIQLADEVPDVVVQRLPLYVRVLGRFESNNVEVVSSEQLGVRLNMTPAQIRKDLSYFGRFGKQGRGYNVQHLASALRGILGLDVSWNAAVFGMGRLGRAVVSYPGFEPEGFRVVAAFDNDERLTGEEIGGLRVQSMREISTTVMSRNVKIGIVTVPAAEAPVRHRHFGGRRGPFRTELRPDFTARAGQCQGEERRSRPGASVDDVLPEEPFCLTSASREASWAIGLLAY